MPTMKDLAQISLVGRTGTTGMLMLVAAVLAGAVAVQAEETEKLNQRFALGERIPESPKQTAKTPSWAKVSEVKAVDLAKQFQGDGVSAIVYTDISRDGMMQGVNVEATAQLAEQIDIPVIASGGITNMVDIKNLCEQSTTGISGAITGRAIYEGSIDLREAQSYADGENA